MSEDLLAYVEPPGLHKQESKGASRASKEGEADDYDDDDDDDAEGEVLLADLNSSNLTYTSADGVPCELTPWELLNEDVVDGGGEPAPKEAYYIPKTKKQKPRSAPPVDAADSISSGGASRTSPVGNDGMQGEPAVSGTAFPSIVSSHVPVPFCASQVQEPSPRVVTRVCALPSPATHPRALASLPSARDL